MVPHHKCDKDNCPVVEQSSLRGKKRLLILIQKGSMSVIPTKSGYLFFLPKECTPERRWSIHSFRYGCLVTTLPWLLTSPWSL